MPEQSGTKNVVYGVALVAIVGATVFFFVRGSRGKIYEMPDAKELAQTFICQKCEHIEQWTPRRQAEALSHISPDQVKRLEGTSARQLILPCPACKELTFRIAGQCPDCKAPFVKVTPDEKRHRFCKLCEPKHVIESPNSLPDAGQ